MIVVAEHVIGIREIAYTRVVYAGTHGLLGQKQERGVQAYRYRISDGRGKKLVGIARIGTHRSHLCIDGIAVNALDVGGSSANHAAKLHVTTGVFVKGKTVFSQ